MTPPGRFFDLYKPKDMPLPDSRHDPLDGAPAHLKQFAAIHPKDQRNWVAPCGYGSDELLAEAIAATYGMITMIDEGVGRIMQTLNQLGIEDNTLVVFTSDHGDMMGEHGLFLKGFMHYRGTLQVPLLIRDRASNRVERQHWPQRWILPQHCSTLRDSRDLMGCKGTVWSLAWMASARCGHRCSSRMICPKSRRL